MIIRDDDLLNLETITNTPEIYYRSVNIKVSTYLCDQWYVTLLDNAMKRGKVCQTYCLRFDKVMVQSETLAYLQGFLGNVTATSLRAYLEKITAQSEPTEVCPGVRISVFNNDSNSTFSPFALHLLTPLKSMPEKWTIAHAKRALANRQFFTLRCIGQFTDDYAHDSDVNFNRGNADPLVLLRMLVSEPSGWRTYVDTDPGVIKINCYHFHLNEMQLDLSKSELL